MSYIDLCILIYIILLKKIIVDYICIFIFKKLLILNHIHIEFLSNVF